jgi:dienelactone hydrolase
VPERLDVAFPSGSDRCAAWLYLPDGGDGPPPVVVMGHGFGGTRVMRLDAYAERFAAAGLAALVFDYRHFGASTGEPRQLLDIALQHEDWAAALAHVRARDDVDAARVALWGTSFGGGHALVAAARDGRVAAVVAQCPFTDGAASLRAVPPATAARLAVRALRDELAARRGRPPVQVPLVGPPGSVAFMTTPDAEEGYRRLVPPGHPDTVAARVALRVGLYRPGRAAARVACPVLFSICEHDTVAPARAARRAAARAPRGEVDSYPIGHFDVYHGDAFERAVADQTRFLLRHLTS